MYQPESNAHQILDHIRHLSVTLGGRGSCTAAEGQAAAYAVDQMRGLGATGARVERYRGSPSTYRPYALAYGAAALGAGMLWLAGGGLPGQEGVSRWGLSLSALLSGLAAWGVLAESDLAPNWMRLLLPKGEGQNAVGVIPPAGTVERHAVLCAHLDTHRTPSFFASATAFRRFMAVMIAGWVGMVAAAIAACLGIAFGWGWIAWLGLFALPQGVVVVQCLRADATPFSPGANDNASGVAVVLELARRLARDRLRQTEVWLAFTDGEEVGAQGMAAFLEAHAAALGPDALYLILDMVGQGRLTYVTADGLLIKHRADPAGLDLARQAGAALPDLELVPQVGVAYTDATLATKSGQIGLTISALPPPGQEDADHWHRPSDTLDHVDSSVLLGAQRLAWQILQELDRS